MQAGRYPASQHNIPIPGLLQAAKGPALWTWSGLRLRALRCGWLPISLGLMPHWTRFGTRSESTSRRTSIGPWQIAKRRR